MPFAIVHSAQYRADFQAELVELDVVDPAIEPALASDSARERETSLVMPDCSGDLLSGASPLATAARASSISSRSEPHECCAVSAEGQGSTDLAEAVAFDRLGRGLRQVKVVRRRDCAVSLASEGDGEPGFCLTLRVIVCELQASVRWTVQRLVLHDAEVSTPLPWLQRRRQRPGIAEDGDARRRGRCPGQARDRDEGRVGEPHERYGRAASNAG